jgi:hypothetical protein
MVAYKRWHGTKNFIHKDTTNELNVVWTENIEDAKDLDSFSEACKFFFDKLGFSSNPSKYDALHLL